MLTKSFDWNKKKLKKCIAWEAGCGGNNIILKVLID